MWREVKQSRLCCPSTASNVSVLAHLASHSLPPTLPQGQRQVAVQMAGTGELGHAWAPRAPQDEPICWSADKCDDVLAPAVPNRETPSSLADVQPALVEHTGRDQGGRGVLPIHTWDAASTLDGLRQRQGSETS